MSETKLLGIYSDGMVFQRNKEIIIEGFESTKSSVVAYQDDTDKTHLH